jgi:hypothetical protein
MNSYELHGISQGLREAITVDSARKSMPPPPVARVETRACPRGGAATRIRENPDVCIVLSRVDGTSCSSPAIYGRAITSNHRHGGCMHHLTNPYSLKIPRISHQIPRANVPLSSRNRTSTDPLLFGCRRISVDASMRNQLLAAVEAIARTYC